MNEQQTFERIVADSVSELGPLTPSDGAIERTLTSVDRRRQRPRWMALIKEPPMRTNSHLAVGSPTVRAAAVLAATLLLMLALAAAGAGARILLAADGDIVVAQDGSGDYTTITEAIEAAVDGDSILVRPGTYSEFLDITKDITITGEGAVVIEAGKQGDNRLGNRDLGDAGPVWYWERVGEEQAYVVFVDASDATLQGVTVRPLDLGTGVAICGASPVIDDVTVEYSGDGASLLVDCFAEPEVRNVDLHGPLFILGPTSEAMEVGGAHVSDSTLRCGIGVNGPSVFERNEIRDAGCTLGIFGGDAHFHRVGAGEPTFRDNDISLETAPIRMQSSTTRPMFEGNRIHESPKGVSIENRAGALFVDNEMIAIGSGIRVDSESSIEMTGNTVSESRFGVMLSGGPSTLTGNTISGAELGINIYGEAEATLRDNTVCDNEVNVQVRGDATADIDDSNEICEDAQAA